MKFILSALFSLSAFAGYTVVSSTQPRRIYLACERKIPNQGRVPAEFLNEVIEIVQQIPDSVFARNSYYEIYSIMAPYLGPWRSDKHRRAAAVDLVITAAALESSWDWMAGIDVNNASSFQNKCNEEAGALQTSGNVLTNFGGDLRTLYLLQCSKYSGNECVKFIKCSKGNHAFAVESFLRLLRKPKGYTHYGPISSGRVPRLLSKECVNLMESVL